MKRMMSVLLSNRSISGKGQNFIFQNQHLFKPYLTNPAMAASTTPESTKNNIMNGALKNFMRWSIFLFFLSLSSINSFAQSPNLLSYQTVIRNSNNELVANATIGMRISILSGTAADVLWYQEEHTVKTNLNGLAYIVIGKGTNLNGIMTEIDWSKGPFYIKSESDPNGGKNYTLIIVSQLLSVPYAIYAKSAEKVTGPITELDPQFNASIAKGITAADTALWNRETDPVFSKSISKGITESDISYWNNKLSSFGETDPSFNESIAKGITAVDTAYWNKKLSSFTETDPLFNVSVAKGITALDTAKWNKILKLSDTEDIADLAITNDKISGIAGSKVIGDIAGNAANVTGTVAVGNGGTGATSLTGYVKGNGSSAMTAVSSIPVADVTGAVKKVNGTLPDSSGEVTILFGRVRSGIYAGLPTSGGVNGDIYIVSGEVVNTSNNGRTFIKDDIAWNEISFNTAATDARYLRLGGGTMEGSLNFPTGKTLILTDAPTGSTDAANKGYVDAKISSEVPNASDTTLGKIQLVGELGGTASSPTVPGLALKAPINNPAFTGTVSGVTKAMVDLGNVDNTSDANKPVSLAAQTALDLKENASNKSDASLGTSTILYPTQNAVKTYVDSQVALGTPDATSSVKGKLQLAGDLAGSASSPTVPGLALKAPINSPAFTGTVSGVTKSMVDLGNVDNTSDANKPVSLAAQTELDLKENASNKSDASLGTSTILYPTQNAVKTYVDSQVALGAPDATSSVKGKLQLAGDLAGSASSPTVPGLALKALINNPSFTGTVTGVTKAMVDLGNVDNTSDMNKPVSSAAQTALDLKENASNKSDASLGTSTILYPTQNAVKTYVDSQVALGTPDATSSVKGKLQLAGDLDGTAALPSIKTSAITTAKLAADAVTSAKIADGEIVNADISTSAAIADSKLATIATANKVSNSATTATNANTASAIVARDASGDFSAGTITATGFSGPLSGNASTATLAATATKLAATKNINGTAFDGSSDITVIADAGTLSGTSLKSTVVSSSLTSVGTLTNLTVTNPIAGSITGSAATLTTAHNIYGNSFDGSANVTGVIAANFGGTGNGFTKFTGASGSEKTYTLPNADAIILTNQSSVAINQGGTGATNKTGAFDALSPMTSPGDIIYGTSGGSGTRLAKGSDNQVLTIVSGLPAWSTSSGVTLPQDANEESLSTLSQTSFTLLHIPISTSKVKMHINGIRISNSAYSVSGTTVSYNAVNNGAYDLTLNDRIQFDYQY
jgi:hypothetical protein